MIWSKDYGMRFFSYLHLIFLISGQAFIVIIAQEKVWELKGLVCRRHGWKSR